MSALQESHNQLDHTLQAFRDQADEPVENTVSNSDLEPDDKLSRKASAFESIPKELIDCILEYLEPAKLLPFDQRESLSFESFASAPPHVPDGGNDIHTFRLLCKKFAKHARSRVFTRVKIRFSEKGFDRKEFAIVIEAEVASGVQKLSYMVHDLYPQDPTKWQQLLLDARTSTATCQRRFDENHGSNYPERAQSIPALRRLEVEMRRCRQNEDIIMQAMARAEEQKRIIMGDVDEIMLTDALSAFRNLQQIRLMRTTDKLDRHWGDFLNSTSTHPTHRREFGTARWTAACERATRVLGRAYFKSNSLANRLSSRFMDPRPTWLHEHISKAAISSLYARLTCLELQIDDPSDLNEKMNQLSTVFGTLFHGAKRMKGLHIGLCRPISVPLETVFHNITWIYLSYIGFSRWNLKSDEIIIFVRRHRGSLKQVRFREVRLREGKWLEILKLLRLELKLTWASFRQVGYEPSIGGGPIPEAGPGGGFALLRGPPKGYEEYSSGSSDDIGEHVVTSQGSESDEEDSSEDGGPDAENNDSDDTVEEVDLESNNVAQSVSDEEAALSDDTGSAGPVENSDHSDESEDSPSGSIAGDSEVGVVNSLALDDQTMVEHSSASDHAESSCNCGNGYAWGSLGDDLGLDPTKQQWKMWERWVVSACSEHDPKGH